MKLDFANKRFVLILVCVSLFWAIAVNEINLAYIKKENPNNDLINSASTVNEFTIWSIDNEWYLPQIKNILAGDGYTLDPKNPELSVRRTPLYSLFYGIHYIVFGETYSFFVIRYTQVLIHILAVLLLGQAIYNISSNSHWAKFSAVFYAINPFTIPYLYFTLTESLSPSLVVFVIYAFSLCYQKASYGNYLLLGVVAAFSSLYRPLLFFLLPSLFLALLFLAYKNRDGLKLKLQPIYLFLFFFAGITLVFAPWVIRNYIVTNGEIVVLEKYYYGDQMDYGRGHEKFRQWISSWTNPANFLPETYSNQVRGAIRQGDFETPDKVKNKFIEDMPESVFQINSKESISDGLDSLNNCYAEKEKVFRQRPNITLKEQYELFNCEEIVSQKFETLKSEYKNKAFLNYYLIVPAKLISSLIFQSGTYHYAILNPLSKQSNSFIFVAKSLMYLLEVLLFFGFTLFCLLNLRKYPAYVIFCSLFVILTLLALAYINRYAEARYIIPLYPMLYSGFAFCVYLLLHKLKLIKN